jgi:hypothetical protein
LPYRNFRGGRYRNTLVAVADGFAVIANNVASGSTRRLIDFTV